MIKEDFIAWLIEQPRERKFHYMDNRGCLFASFLKETNPPNHVFFVGGVTYILYIDQLKQEVAIPPWARELTAKVISPYGPSFTVAQVCEVLKFLPKP